MSVVLLDTNVASLLHPKKKAAALRRHACRIAACAGGRHGAGN